MSIEVNNESAIEVDEAAVPELLQDTGVTQDDLTQAIAALPGEPKVQSGLLDNMDNVNLN